jgi:hypothetical protein
MPNLKSISLKNCNLSHIWPILSPQLEQLMLNGNFMNCIPHEVSHFISMDTTTWDFFSIEQSEVEKFMENL